MLKDIFDFLAAKGLLSPTILAVAIVGVVYFQSQVDADQRKSIGDLQEQTRVIAQQQAETSANLRLTAAILARIDDHGTKHEMELRERELDRREGANGGKP